MSGEPQPAPGVPLPPGRKQAVFGLLVAAAVVGVLAWLIPRALDSAAGPEAELLVALKRYERDGIEEALPSGTLRGAKAQYARLAFTLDGEGRATVRATLDFSGTFSRPDGEVTQVSSLGVEVVGFVREGESWRLERGPCPLLAAALTALEARRKAIEAGDVSALGVRPEGELQEWITVGHRRLRAKAWYLRSERDEVTVSEDFRLTGDLPDRPVDLQGTKRLTLQSRGREFFFPHGLM